MQGLLHTGEYRFHDTPERPPRPARTCRRCADRLLGRCLIKFLVLVLFLVAAQQAAQAFTVERDGTHLYISGKIGIESPGVFNRNLVETLLELALAGDRDSSIHLHLDLPKGGVAAPAFKLVDLIRSAQSQGTKFVAHVDRGTTCMSGCTFMFLAANQRWIAPEGRLVFHGFSQADPSNPVEVPQHYHDAYYALLKSANEPFYRFFRQSRIIEEDRKVGFTGKTLFARDLFAGLITGLTVR